MGVESGIKELVERALDAAASAGASYADARFLNDEWEAIDVQDDRVQGVDRGTTAGIGIRVLVDGAWGFAGSARLDPASIDRAAALAVEIARSSQAVKGPAVRLADEPPQTTSCATAIEEDPFAVPLEDKIS